MPDAQLRRRVLRSLAALQLLLGRHGPEGTTVEHDDWVAAVVPPLQDAPLVNTLVVFDDHALPHALDHMTAVYAEAGLERWGILLDATSPAVGTTLAQAGAQPHGAPTAMVADLDPRPVTTHSKPKPPVPHPIAPQTIGAINDIAYIHPDDRMERLIERLPTDANRPPDARTRTYALDHDGETASVALTHDHARDATVSFVATLPWARRHGLASHLLRHALHDAARRGCTTSSLLASIDGRTLYERLGYRPLTGIEVWRRRTRRP